jgi:hypothetical protein
MVLGKSFLLFIGIYFILKSKENSKVLAIFSRLYVVRLWLFNLQISNLQISNCRYCLQWANKRLYHLWLLNLATEISCL